MSCITESSIKPKEGGTGVVTLVFTDEDGNTVVPTSLQWQLSDDRGNIINNNTFASNDFTGNTVVLQGDDLALQSPSDDGDRYFAVQGVYASSAGTGLPLKGEMKFTICNLLNIADG